MAGGGSYDCRGQGQVVIINIGGRLGLQVGRSEQKKIPFTKPHLRPSIPSPFFSLASPRNPSRQNAQWPKKMLAFSNPFAIIRVAECEPQRASVGPRGRALRLANPRLAPCGSPKKLAPRAQQLPTHSLLSPQRRIVFSCQNSTPQKPKTSTNEAPRFRANPKFRPFVHKTQAQKELPETKGERRGKLLFQSHFLHFLQGLLDRTHCTSHS